MESSQSSCLILAEVSALLLSRPDTDTLIREILQRVQSACRRKPVKWLDTASPVEANKCRLMFLDRGDKATQPRQAFAELQEGMFRKAL
jgi:hypothetical protein